MARHGITRFYTILELADLMRVGDKTVRRWIKNKGLRAHRIAGVLRIAESDLRTFLAVHHDD